MGEQVSVTADGTKTWNELIAELATNCVTYFATLGSNEYVVPDRGLIANYGLCQYRPVCDNATTSFVTYLATPIPLSTSAIMYTVRVSSSDANMMRVIFTSSGTLGVADYNNIVPTSGTNIYIQFIKYTKIS